MNQQEQSPMQDKDWINSILTYEKHMASEYTTAVTESSCTVVRQMFTSLLNDTLRTQEDVFQLMSQQGWYTVPAKAIRHEVDKQLQTYQQTQQQLTHSMDQRRRTMQHPGYIPTQYPGSVQPAPTQHTSNIYQPGH